MDLRYTVTRYLYRPVSVPAAHVLARTSITPVQITVFSAALSFGGAIAFGYGRYLLGSVLTLAGVIADCIDGDLARITGRTSRWGAFLDSVLDRWTDAAMILGLGLSAPVALGPIAGFALMAALLTSYTRARAQSLGTDCPEGVGGRDVRILILVISAPLGYAFEGLALVAGLGTFTSIHRLVNAGRSLRDMDGAEGSGEDRETSRRRSRGTTLPESGSASAPGG